MKKSKSASSIRPVVKGETTLRLSQLEPKPGPMQAVLPHLLHPDGSCFFFSVSGHSGLLSIDKEDNSILWRIRTHIPEMGKLSELHHREMKLTRHCGQPAHKNEVRLSHGVFSATLTREYGWVHITSDKKKTVLEN